MTLGRLLGIDTGTKRVGLAISDADRIIASPLTTLQRQNSESDAQFFRDLIARESVVGIIVGLPMHTDGREGVKAQEARAYGDWLATITNLSVEYADERFTTVHAESALWDAGLTHQKRKDRRDRVAAQIMLQAYLDDKRVQPK
jgi:putative holliday junction resolvase